MAFDPGAQAKNLEGFAKQHPLATVGIVVGVFVLVWYLVSSGSSSSTSTTAATGSSSDATTQAAADIQSAQTSANEQTAIAQIAAGVTNNQTAAAQAVSLATISGQTQAAVAASAATTASAYYGAETAISGNNSAVAIAGLQAQSTEQTSENTLLSSEFSNLADVLKSFGNNAQAITTSGNSSQVALGESANALTASLASTGASEYGSYITAATTPVTTTNSGIAGAGGQIAGVFNFSQSSLPNVAPPSSIVGNIPSSGASNVASGSVQTQTLSGLGAIGSYFSSGLSALSNLFGTTARTQAPATSGTAIAQQATTANAGIASNLVVPTTSTQLHP